MDISKPSAIPAPPFAADRPSKIARLSRWAGLAAAHGAALAGVQALGFVSGIWIIRRLDPHDYAVFTLAASAVATMVMLADGGLTTALTALGGRVWQDRFKLGRLFQTILRYRRVFAAVAALLVVPFLIAVLRKHQVPPLTIAAICAVSVATLLIGLSNNLSMVVLRLNSQLGRIQNAEFASVTARLACLLPALAVFPSAVVALLCAIPGQLAQSLLHARSRPAFAAPDAQPDPSAKPEITGIVKHSLPNTVYAALAGQINVWILSIFGSSREVADIGALGRFAAIFAVISALQTNIVAPYLARVQNPALVGRRFIQLALLSSAPYALLIPAAAVFPEAFLLVLGSKYAHLETELLLITVLFFVTGTQSVLFALNSARGWVLPAQIALSTGIAAQCILLLTSDLGSVRGVLVMSIKLAVAGIIVTALFTASRLRKSAAAA